MLSPERKKFFNYLLGIIVTAFVLLTVFVIIDPQSIIDIDFSHEVQEHQNPLLDKIMIAISWFGYNPASTYTVAFTTLIFLLFKFWREALFIALTSLAGLVSLVVKLLINRPRPSDKLVRVVMKTQQQSFPSGHVLFYVTFFGFLILLMYRLTSIPKFIRIVVGVISLVLICTVPVSRVYLGAHWFTDVTAGFFLGLICLYILGYQYLKRAAAN